MSWPKRIEAPCTVEGCGKPFKARGICAMHYRRWFKHGDPLFVEFIRGAVKEPKNRNPTNRSIVVYGLASSENGKIRYVGQTAQKLSVRFNAHMWPNASRGNAAVNQWVSDVRAGGFRVECFVLDSDAVWNETETRLIAWYRKHGADLVNTTAGGAGTLGHAVSEETKRKLSAAHLGRKKSPEHVAKSAAAKRGKPLSAAHRAKVSAANKGRRPSNLESLWAQSRGRPWSEKQRRATMAAHAAKREAKASACGL